MRGLALLMAIETGLVPLLSYQREAVARESQFSWNCWSRQTGKSFAFSLRRILRGMKRNRNQILLSAGERQSRELMGKVRTHLTAMRAALDATTEDMPDGTFEGTTIGKLETRVRHRDGAFDFRIIALPANPLTARGYTGDIFLDEFAMHRDDREIWASIYPIALRGKGEIDICSTPKGRKNMFYRLGGNDQFVASTVNIRDAVAAGLDVDVESVRRAMADDDLFAQEFMCEFLDEATAFLTFEMIAACEDAELRKTWDDAAIEACANETLYVGVDIGRHRDLTVIWIWGKPKSSNLLLTRGVIELSRMPFEMQESILRPILRLPQTARACIDATGMGEQFAERAVSEFGAHRVEPVKFTAEVKNTLATRLRVKVEDRTARIPVDADIRNDWHAIERQVMPGGGVRYAADRGAQNGAHSDRFWAAALGLQAGDVAWQKPEFRHAGRPMFGGDTGRWM